MVVRSGCAVDANGKAAGKGALVQTERASTLSTVQDQYLFQPVTFEPGIAQREGGHIYEGVSGTLRAKMGDNQMAVAYDGATPGQPVYSVENHPADSRVNLDESGKVQTLTSRMGTGGGNVPMVMEVVGLDRASFNQGKNAQYDFEVSDNGVNSPLVAKGPSAVCYPEVGDGIAGTLDAHYSNFPGCRGGMERTMVAQAVDCRNGTEDSVNGALQSNSAHSLNGNNVVRTRYIVRRLTPLECERLQGYPDGWTDIGEWVDTNGKKRQTSDAARYKALGNSIALPPWKWVLKRLCACYERDATMASLFDGIGGFPYLWEQLNGKGTCLWASEIEEFPIAVTKVRIGE
jgi:site-specific DNA-cytosine methylase